MEDEQVDEVVLNVLLAEGLDVPTALAASIKDDASRSTSQWPAVIGLIAALASVLAWLSLG